MKKMKNKLKKGFTIVELVIVIAVIAILAAVLIPTFSSITNSARESAALQEAKSGSETILALTTGTLPENSAFIVADDEESDTNDYTFVFAGQKIQNVNAVEEFSDVLTMCKRNDVMTSGSATEGYIVYVSTKALDVNEEEQVIAGKINQHVANRILSAIGVTATVTDGTDNNYTVSASRDYAMWNFQEGDKTYYFNIYWTSDFNPTLIAFMGGNVAGESADDEPEAETVNVTATGATVDKTTVEKGKDADLVLTLPAEGTPYAAYYTVTVGEFTTDVQQVDGKLTVKIPSQYTGSDFNITVKVATVAITYSATDNAATVNSIAYSEGMKVNKKQEVKIVLTNTVEVGKITIKVGGTPINQPGDWTYDAESKTITIPADEVTGNIEISIT